MKNGIYIYGVISTGDTQEFGEIGIGDNASVRTLGFKDIAAIVSISPFTTYDSLTREKTVKELVTHQFVIEKVMQRFTIVPLKFGTMLETEDEALQFLEKGYALLSEELRKMEGKIELDVVVSWELPKILAAISRESHQVQSKQRELALQGHAVAIEDKVALGQLVEQALKTQKASYTQLILQMLSDEAVDVCMHDVANDEMLLNTAFLVEKQHEESFHETITLLDSRLENTVNFRVVGPLPPYSFSTILLKRTDPSSFEEAKKLFGLQGEITDKTVRGLYRQLAQKSHPDTNGGEHALDFSQLSAAYRTLKDVVEQGLMQVEVYRWGKDFS